MARVGEYIWDGKYDEGGLLRSVAASDVRINDRVIERIGDEQTRNLLMRGDALGACAMLARDEINIQCCYIDPPFDVGHDFAMTADGPVAYRDSWGNGERSYVHMMYERCSLVRDVLADDGCLLVHCDWRVSHQLRLMLDEVFGAENFRNEIIWSYRSGGASRKKSLPRKHDTILLYAKSSSFMIRPLTERQYLGKAFMGSKVDESGRHYVDTLLRDVIEGAPTVLDQHGKPEVVNCRPVLNVSADRLGYPTQKPRGLLELLIRATTDPGDAVADFFCGSGTTLDAAARTGRRFIGADLGGQGFRTSRARLIRCGASFDVVDLGVTRRRDMSGVDEEMLFSRYGAKKSNDGVWRREGVRCEVGVERAIACGERDVVALVAHDAGDIANVDDMERGIRLVVIPREVYDPSEREDLRWEAPASLMISAIRSETRLRVKFEGARVGDELISAKDFADSWAIDVQWPGDGPLAPQWRSNGGHKGETLIAEAEIDCRRSIETIGVLVVDLHGNVYRTAVSVHAEREPRVPIIRA